MPTGKAYSVEKLLGGLDAHHAVTGAQAFVECARMRRLRAAFAAVATTAAPLLQSGLAPSVQSLIGFISCSVMSPVSAAHSQVCPARWRE